MTTEPSYSLDKVMHAKATSLLVRRLVWAGIIPPHKFTKALNLTAGNSFLKRYGLLFLSLIGFAYIIAGICALAALVWQDIPFVVKVLLLASALIISSFLASNKEKPILRIVFTCCSLLLTGGLLVISGDSVAMGKPLWPIAILWAVLVLPWTILAQNLVVWIFWLGIATTAFCLWGIEAGMPSGIIAWHAFFSIMAAFMGCILALRELLVYFKYFPFIKHQASRLIPLTFGLTLSLVPIIGYLFGLKEAALSDSIIIFVLMSVLAILVYIKIFPDRMAIAIVVFEFCCVLSGCCIYKYIYSHDAWYIIFLAIIAVFGLGSFLLRKVNYKAGRKEINND